MPNEDLIHRDMYCTICAAPLSPERLKTRSITCSEDCQKVRKRMLRKRVDDRECRFCHKPSTPNARRAYMRFRIWEAANPDQAHPEVWAILAPAGVTIEEFRKAVAQSVRVDVEFDPELSDMDWGSTRNRVTDDPTPELERVLEVLKAHHSKAKAKAKAKAKKPKKKEAA